jgi:hypothetical protein
VDSPVSLPDGIGLPSLEGIHHVKHPRVCELPIDGPLGVLDPFPACFTGQVVSLGGDVFFPLGSEEDIILFILTSEYELFRLVLCLERFPFHGAKLLGGCFVPHERILFGKIVL